VAHSIKKKIQSIVKLVLAIAKSNPKKILKKENKYNNNNNNNNKGF
jgi:hypothetical protein